MTANPPDSLQRLLDEEPFVRLLARTLLAEEADEVVQQTWLAAVRHGGVGVAEPRSWLARIARNVATNLRRGRLRRAQKERDGALRELVPSSADLLAREEQRRLLVAAVDRLPPPMRTVVLLRYFDGLPPRRIAGQLGVPVATVWNRLREGLQLLRERLDAEHGGQRRAWLLPLVPFAAGHPGAPWVGPTAAANTFSTLGLGVIVMTMKTKLVASLAVLLTASGALVLWATRDTAPAPSGPPTPVAEHGATASSPLPRDGVATAPAESQAQREPLPVAGAADATGALVVHVRWSDKTPAAGVTMIVRRSGASSRVDAVRRKTDAAGIARFEALAAGRFQLSSDRGWLGKRAEIRSGETTEFDYELAVGLTLTGIVVDATGAPVASALVEVAERGNADSEVEPLATSGPDGRFVVRSAPAEAVVGARAVGHSSSPMQTITGKDGNAADVRLQLGAPAGTVSGLVVDAQNRPVADAFVRIGESKSPAGAPSGGSAPIPAHVRTDADGRFTAIGVPPGIQPVAARARDKAPWQGTCEVTANLTTPLRIELGAGASIRGSVRDSDGAAVAQAVVTVGDYDSFFHSRCSTSAEGFFELRGLPGGDVKVTARHDTAGTAEKSTPTVAGTVTPCDLQLVAGLELRGRIVDETGAPVAGAGLQCMAISGGLGWARGATSGPDGRFTLPNCPSGERLSVTVRAAGFDSPPHRVVDPAQGPIEFRLQRVAPATAKLRGIVADATGAPLPNVRVMAFGPGSPDASRSRVTGPDGSFELGPVPPGSWRVQVVAPQHPPYASPPVVLAAEQTVDLGLVQLPAGGTAAVRVDGDRKGVRLFVVDAAAQTTRALTDDGTTLSVVLLPGEYRVLVAGASVAADAIPFTVRAGEQTQVTVKLQPGVRQKFDVVADGAAVRPQAIVLRVHRGAELVARASVPLPAGKPAGAELCLAPGEYVASAVDGESELARAPFTVAPGGSPPVRLALR